MNHDPEKQLPTEFELTSDAGLAPAILSFMRIAKFRKNTLLGSIGVFILLGMAYFLFATRQYGATAKLLIIQQKQDHVSTVGDHDNSDNIMATHRELVKSAVVIQGAIEKLEVAHRIDLQGVSSRDWVETFEERLSAKTTRKTNFIEVSYHSRSPDAAMAIVNAVIQSYLRFIDKTHKGTAGDVIKTLSQERDQLQQSLAVKQGELQQFRQKVGHIAINPNDGIVEPIIQRAIHFNDALLTIQEERLKRQSALVSINYAIARGEDINQHLAGVETVVGRQMLLAALGLSPQDMQLVGEQEKRRLAIQSELKGLAVYYGPNHPRMTELRNELQTIDAFLSNYRTNVGARFKAMNNSGLGPIIQRMLHQSVQDAELRERKLLTSFEQARAEAATHSGDIAQLQMLEREVARLESLHDLLFEKIAAVDILQVQAPIQATVVQEPVPNPKPVSPQLRFTILFSLLGGLACGGVLAYIQDILDDRFSSPESMTTQLGVPVLAVVRKLEPIDGDGFQGVHLHAKPTSAETESFRTLRTALALGSDSADRILISSSEPSDGKTTISANLAVAFAQAGKKTLAIDADLRKPGMSTLLGLKGHPGVADILTSDRIPKEVATEYALPTDVANLHVLPVGLRCSNPAELLGSKNFAELLAWADSQYDQVLVDCPPILAVSDAQIVGQLVDGAILVVRPDKNHRRVVIRAVESFHATGCRLLGIVANGISENSGSYSYGYGYGYAYGYDYGHDNGYDDENNSEYEMASKASSRNDGHVGNDTAAPEGTDTSLRLTADDSHELTHSPSSTEPPSSQPHRAA